MYSIIDFDFTEGYVETFSSKGTMSTFSLSLSMMEGCGLQLHVNKKWKPKKNVKGHKTGEEKQKSSLVNISTKLDKAAVKGTRG